MDEKQLNGTERVAFNDVANGDQCGKLMRLAQVRDVHVCLRLEHLWLKKVQCSIILN